MTATQLTRIAIALGVVLLLWGAAEILGGGIGRGGGAVPIRSTTMDEADTVELRRSDDTLVLVKDGGRWTVDGFASDVSLLRDLFADFGDSLRAELVARSPSSHTRMGVDSAGGKRLRIVAGDRTLIDLWVGNRGTVWEGIFVRPEGDDRVYELRGRLAGAADRPLNDWRDKRIVEIEPDSVAQVALERGRRRYVLERVTDGWRFADGGAADAAKATRLVGAYRSLVAQGSYFATEAEAAAADFARPDRRITMLAAGGDTLAALAFDSTDTGFWVRRSFGGPVFHLFTWKVDDLVPPDSALRVNP